MKQTLAMAILLVAAWWTCAQDKAEIKVVKYPELGQLVRQHLGKVVVVDFWTTT